MTTYYVDIIICPKCSFRFGAWNVSSCNTFGAAFFTDGFVQGPMYEESSALLSCPNDKCLAVFWRDDILVESSMRDSEFFRSEKNDKHENNFWRTLAGTGPALIQYPVLVENKFWRTADEEKYIRIRAWWAWNNSGGRNSKSMPNLSIPAVENCKRLLELIDTTDDKGNIMCAEILRELGRFSECLKQLDRPFPDEYTNVVRIIRRLSGENNRCVSKIN